MIRMFLFQAGNQEPVEYMVPTDKQMQSFAIHQKVGFLIDDIPHKKLKPGFLMIVIDMFMTMVGDNTSVNHLLTGITGHPIYGNVLITALDSDTYQSITIPLSEWRSLFVD
jgi:hypothetical protein